MHDSPPGKVSTGLPASNEIVGVEESTGSLIRKKGSIKVPRNEIAKEGFPVNSGRNNSHSRTLPPS